MCVCTGVSRGLTGGETPLSKDAHNNDAPRSQGGGPPTQAHGTSPPMHAQLRYKWSCVSTPLSANGVLVSNYVELSAGLARVIVRHVQVRWAITMAFRDVLASPASRCELLTCVRVC